MTTKTTERIEKLEKALAVAETAVKLACEDLNDAIIDIDGVYTTESIDELAARFTEQAKEKLNNERK